MIDPQSLIRKSEFCNSTLLLVFILFLLILDCFLNSLQIKLFHFLAKVFKLMKLRNSKFRKLNLLKRNCRIIRRELFKATIKVVKNIAKHLERVTYVYCLYTRLKTCYSA